MPADPVRVHEIIAEEGWLDAERAERLVQLTYITSLSACDARFCQLSVRKKILSREQLEACQAEQQRMLARCGQAPLMAFVALRRKYATAAQVGAIVEQEAQEGVGVLAAARRGAPRVNAVLLAAIFVSLLACSMAGPAPWPAAMPLRYKCAACGEESAPSARRPVRAKEAANDIALVAVAISEMRGLTCPACEQPKVFRAYRCGGQYCGHWFVPKSAMGPVPAGHVLTCPECAWRPTIEPADKQR